MRRGLLVGIDAYPGNELTGCVADAIAMTELLATHETGGPNIDCKILVSSDTVITRSILRSDIERLFQQKAELAVFYFSGHGLLTPNLGGYLVTPDAESYDVGVPMSELLNVANRSPVEEVVIILDCCDSGSFGRHPDLSEARIYLREGISVLTASGTREAAIEVNGRGVFTTLVCAALSGGASDVIGEVNAASIYSYCDQILGAWDQRPHFMANVSKLTDLRMCNPKIELSILRLLAQYFPSQDYQYPLDPTYEPDKRNLPADADTSVNLNHEEIFGHLQKYRAARLVEPVGEEHMYYAAVRYKSCQLTPLGQFYWSLARNGKL